MGAVVTAIKLGFGPSILILIATSVTYAAVACTKQCKLTSQELQDETSTLSWLLLGASIALGYVIVTLAPSGSLCEHILILAILEVVLPFGYLLFHRNMRSENDKTWCRNYPLAFCRKNCMLESSIPIYYEWK